MLAGVALFALASVGGNCDSTSGGSDAGAATDGSAASDSGHSNSDAGGDAGGSVAATCAGVCACLASACSDYPFQPDCMTACTDPTNNPTWDLNCRASECQAAKADHDGHCPNASGQTMCH